jgi:UDP-N-acetyl-D-glucosamine dehydrogenase
MKVVCILFEVSNWRNLKIAVIGLGKIGLPLAVKIATTGHQVYGVDVDPVWVKEINSAQVIEVSEPQLAEMTKEVVDSSLFKATVDFEEAIPHADVVIVVVPLLLDDSRNPDFTIVDDASIKVASHMKKGTLVIYETTLPVGATRKRLGPILERHSNMRMGIDFLLAYSPERVYSGRIFENLRTYPKLVGGIDEESEKRAKKFYESVLEFDQRPDLDRPNGVWSLGSVEAAELAKLAETTYRDVNIALANQFATHAQELGVDIYRVIEACNSQPFSHIHQPGIAVGGHCIPVYPELYLSSDSDARLIAEARRVNLKMPEKAVHLLQNELGSLAGKCVVILGLAYRGGVKEHAYSGAWPLHKELRRLGAEVKVHDPLYSDSELTELGLDPFHLGESCDGALLQSNHEEYLALGENDLSGLKVLVDGRNFVNRKLFPNSRIVVIGIG